MIPPEDLKLIYRTTGTFFMHVAGNLLGFVGLFYLLSIDFKYFLAGVAIWVGRLIAAEGRRRIWADREIILEVYNRNKD